VRPLSLPSPAATSILLFDIHGTELPCPLLLILEPGMRRHAATARRTTSGRG